MKFVSAVKRYMRYPWDKWFRGKKPGDKITLVKGIDYCINSYMMCQNIRNRVSRGALVKQLQGLRLRISVRNDRLLIEVRGEPDDA